MNLSDFIIEHGILLKYVGSGGDVIIPEGVREIQRYAFTNCIKDHNKIHVSEDSRVTSITFPKTLETICDNAFFKNIKLKQINFSTGLKRIGMNAFSECHALTELNIPEGVTWIETSAFGNCKGLQHVRIPSSVTTFTASPYNPYAYEGLTNLETFTIETYSQNKELVTFLASRLFSLESLVDYYVNGKIHACEPLKKAFLKRLNTKSNRVRFLGEFIRTDNIDMTTKFLALIPKISPEELDDYIQNAEKNPTIRSLFLDYKNRLYSATELSEMANIQAEKDLGLRERTLADWKKIYKINAMDEIVGYKASDPIAQIPASIKTRTLEVGANAFKHCDFLESVTIAEGIKQIGNSAFNGCSNLKQITIPSTLEKIGASAFKNCTSLTDLYFSDKITNIGSKAFEGCNLLVIHAPSGSKILQYAKKNQISFIEQS